jgi:uncharacterized protein (TIGR03382 family)
MTRTQISIVLVCLVAASPAYAHFNLVEPANWTTQNADGDPQKLAPCGNEGTPAPTDNGTVQEYKAGSVVNISINETIPHPGHYRVSLAADRASLPPDPAADVVSTGPGNKECTSLAINPNPTLPLLADGLLVKTTGTTGPRTMQVTLPAGMTCDHCVLQVVEFMSNHPASCFYHHCANIKISTNGPVGGGGTDAGPVGGGGVDAGPVGGGGNDAGVDGGASGGGCSVAGKDVTGVALLAMTVGLVLARRRRR